MPSVPVTTVLAESESAFAGLGGGAAAIVLYALLGLVMLVFAFFVIDWTTPGPLRQYVRGGHPNAALIAGSGMLGMALVVVTAIWTSGSGLVYGLAHTVVYGLLGIVVQALAARLLELVVNVNVGHALEAKVFTSEAGLVAACHLALGLIVAVAII